MSNLLIVGAGGHGKVVADTAQATGAWEEIAFIDDRYPELHETLSLPVVGKINSISKFKGSFSDIIVAIGDAVFRLSLIQHFVNEGFHLPSLIHPTAWVSQSVEINEGCVVFAQAAVNADVQIGRGSIINTGATVDHDCMIGDGVHICPGVHLAGETHVGHASWIGIGSSVIQQVHIGSGVTVGAGSVVIHGVEAGATVAGVPAMLLKGKK